MLVWRGWLWQCYQTSPPLSSSPPLSTNSNPFLGTVLGQERKERNGMDMERLE